MTFEKQYNKGVLIISLSGELDEKSAAMTRNFLDKAISETPASRFVLDFSRVDFMDSTGIGVLLGRYKRLKAEGVEFCVTGINSQIDKVFRISGLYQIIKAV